MTKLNGNLPKIGFATAWMIAGGLVGFGVAYKTIDVKAENALLNAYRNENRIKDLEAITKTLELSARSWSIGIDQINKSMDEWKNQNAKEHDEIKATIIRENRKPVSWVPQNKDYFSQWENNDGSYY